MIKKVDANSDPKVIEDLYKKLVTERLSNFTNFTNSATAGLVKSQLVEESEDPYLKGIRER